MSHRATKWTAYLAPLLVLTLLLAACGGGPSKSDLVQAANIPPSFDVTLIADKDNQFDYDGAPLTEEDLKSALRYRKDRNLPMGTVLLKRGEKERIKKEHIIALARVAYQMHVRAFMQAKDGTISELVARPKEGDDEPAPSPPAKGRPASGH